MIVHIKNAVNSVKDKVVKILKFELSYVKNIISTQISSFTTNPERR